MIISNTRPAADLATTFHKRVLPKACIAFSSQEGKEIFRNALSDGTMECYFGIAEQFRTQAEPAYCALGSLVMALNALGADPQRVWRDPWRWYDEEMLDCCSPLEVVKTKGITMPEFSCLANCNGADVKTKYGEESTEEEFREDLMDCVKNELTPDGGKVLVVSYNRQDVGQTGMGHFSPIAGYSRERDMLLLMDTARFKYPPHWIRVSEIFNATKAHDPVTQRSRGWHVVTKRQSELSVVHFPLHLASPVWDEVIRTIKVASCEGDEQLFQALISVSSSAELSHTLPHFVRNIPQDRRDALNGLKTLDVYQKFPNTMTEERRLILTLIYQAFEKTKKVFDCQILNSEIKSVKNILNSINKFCCRKNGCESSCSSKN